MSQKIAIGLDLLVKDRVIVELKSVSSIIDIPIAQALSCMKHGRRGISYCELRMSDSSLEKVGENSELKSD